MFLDNQEFKHLRNGQGGADTLRLWQEDPRTTVFQPYKEVIILFVQMSHFMIDLHIISSKAYRSNVKTAVIQAGRWLMVNSDFIKLVSFIPETRTSALALARNFIGMKYEGLLSKAYRENNGMIDCHIYGMTRREVLHFLESKGY